MSVKVRIRSFQTRRLDPSADQERTTAKRWSIWLYTVMKRSGIRPVRSGSGAARILPVLGSIAPSSSQVSPRL